MLSSANRYAAIIQNQRARRRRESLDHRVVDEKIEAECQREGNKNRCSDDLVDQETLHQIAEREHTGGAQ